METVRFHTFALRVQPSSQSNDHEVRILGDGEELIDRFWQGMMGLDPDQILLDPSPITATAGPRSATVARCDCGEVGCGSVEVVVRADGDEVRWIDGERTLTFPARAYASELARAQRDTSWETPERTAARLVREGLDRKALSKHGLTFEWASGRMARHTFTVSMRLVPGPYQVLASVPSSAESPQALADTVLEILRHDPRFWQRVEYFPQQPGLGPPKLSGPGWQRGGA